MTRRLLPVFLLAATLAFFLPAPASGADAVRIGYIPVGDCLQLFVAEELGYFARAGLVVEKKPIQGGPLIAMAVEAGELDVGWSNTVSLLQAQDKGFDFAILAPGAFEAEPDRRVHCLLVRQGSAIRSVADLAGKTVAVNALGNINELALLALAAEGGIDPRSLRLVETPFPQMEAALTGGRVDAALAIEPFVTMAQAGGRVEILVRAAHQPFGDRVLVATWFARRSWLEANRDKAEALRRALLDASAFIEAQPDRAREILARRTTLPSDLARRIALPLFADRLDAADVQPLIKLAAKRGFISRPIPAARFLGAGAR